MVKPGIRTTEFWLSLAALIFGGLALFGVISPDDVEPATQAVGQIAGGVITILAIFGYTVSRGLAKRNGGK
jgi:hypothetical protein